MAAPTQPLDAFALLACAVCDSMDALVSMTGQGPRLTFISGLWATEATADPRVYPYLKELSNDDVWESLAHSPQPQQLLHMFCQGFRARAAMEAAAAAAAAAAATAVPVVYNTPVQLPGAAAAPSGSGQASSAGLATPADGQPSNGAVTDGRVTKRELSELLRTGTRTLRKRGMHDAVTGTLIKDVMDATPTKRPRLAKKMISEQQREPPPEEEDATCTVVRKLGSLCRAVRARRPAGPAVAEPTAPFPLASHTERLAIQHVGL